MNQQILVNSMLLICGVACFILILGFRPHKTERIDENLFAISCGMVNFYALQTATGVVLFDCGQSSLQAVRGLKVVDILPEQVSHVFLTHSDYDHLGGLAAFPEATVYLAEAEVALATGRIARRGPMRNRLKATYTTLEDGEVQTIGDYRIRMRLAPGHTPGSAIYLLDGIGTIITGDLLRIGRRGELQPFSRLMNMDQRRNEQSLQELTPILEQATLLLSGHTGIRKAAL